MLFLLLKKERLRISNVIVILYCPPKEDFLYRNFQLRPRKSVRCEEVCAKNCPLHGGFLIRILYETSPFLKRFLLALWAGTGIKSCYRVGNLCYSCLSVKEANKFLR